MKNLLFLLLFPACICLAQTPKAKYLTREEVIELIQKSQPHVTYEDPTRDTDGDGVIDRLDREANTPKDCPVDTRGESTDLDGDGVKDCDDKEPFTLPGYPVDPNGVATRMPYCNCDLSLISIPFHQYFNPVYFGTNTYTLSAETQVSLKTIAMTMQKNSSVCFAIEGYVSQKEAKDEKNVLNLSYNRAKAVADFITNNYSIDGSRLKIKIKGNNDIVKIINTPEDYIYNQRVEFYIVRCSESSDEAPK
jgi:outer membrane protein OmpA-like peptidoglycan-associated protein